MTVKEDKAQFSQGSWVQLGKFARSISVAWVLNDYFETQYPAACCGWDKVHTYST
jgi:hypothetical protein